MRRGIQRRALNRRRNRQVGVTDIRIPPATAAGAYPLIDLTGALRTEIAIPLSR